MIQTNPPTYGVRTENELKRSLSTDTRPLSAPDQVTERTPTPSVYSIIGGALVVLGGLFEASNVGSLGIFVGSTTIPLGEQDRLILGSFGIVFGIVMIASWYMLRSHPEEHVPWGVVVLILPLLSIFTSLAGFVIGLLFGLAGAGKDIRWNSPPVTLLPDSGLGKAYARDFLSDLDINPGEEDRIIALYKASGLDGVVGYLREEDPELTIAEAIPVATRIMQEIDLRRRRNDKRQDTILASEPPKQETAGTGANERETSASQHDKKEKSWVDKWLER